MSCKQFEESHHTRVTGPKLIMFV